MSPGDGAKLVIATERLAAAQEKRNALAAQQNAQSQQLAGELYYFRMMLFTLMKLQFPEIAEALDKALEKLSPPTPPKVLTPQVEEPPLSVEERVAQVMNKILSQPASAQRATGQRPPVPQTGHQTVPQGAQASQNFRDRLKKQGGQDQQTRARPLQAEPEDEPEEGLDLRKFATKPQSGAQ